jgi:hypothetical protein
LLPDGTPDMMRPTRGKPRFKASRTSHGIRKWLTARMTEGGKTTDPMMAVTGQTTEQAFRIYHRRANRKLLAVQALDLDHLWGESEQDANKKQGGLQLQVEIQHCQKVRI